MQLGSPGLTCSPQVLVVDLSQENSSFLYIQTRSFPYIQTRNININEGLGLPPVSIKYVWLLWYMYLALFENWKDVMDCLGCPKVCLMAHIRNNLRRDVRVTLSHGQATEKVKISIPSDLERTLEQDWLLNSPAHVKEACPWPDL